MFYYKYTVFLKKINMVKYKEYKHFRNIPGVYLITIAKHTYVGSSINLYSRIRVHLTTLQKGKHENQFLLRTYQKYNTINITVLKTYKEITKIDLLIEEKKFIDLLIPDLNLKRDPVTETNCKSTSRSVFQFDLFGNFIKKWDCISEAVRQLNIKDSSGITVACRNPKRQYKVNNYLWSYEDKPLYIKLIYVYDSYGQYVDKYCSTVDIFNRLFPTENRKTILTCVKSAIDKHKLYKGYSYYSMLQHEPVIEKSKKLIYQFTLDNELINCFSSINDIPSNYSLRGIKNCLSNKEKSAYGYLWSYTKDINYNNNLYKPVTVYSNTGEKVAEFSNISKAIRYLNALTTLKYSNTSISRVINKNVLYKNFYFKQSGT